MTRNCFAAYWYSLAAVLLFFTPTSAYSQAQRVDGYSPYADTSFTTWSAFIKTRQTHPEIQMVPELRSKKITEKRNIEYQRYREGKLILSLDAFLPVMKSTEKRPAIVIIHGGGWRSGNRTQHHPLAQHLAARGYICFTPDYRLSTVDPYPAAIHDLKRALRWVVQHAGKYHVDTSKIAVLGFSAGGELAAFLGTTLGNPTFEGPSWLYREPIGLRVPAPIHAVIDIDGTLSFTHPETGEGDDSKKISAATYWLGYKKADSLALWEEASPLTHVGPHTPPTLFLNSSVARMHAGRDDFIKVLNKYNIYSEVKTFENAPHAFCLFHPWFEPTVNYIDDFLKKVFR
ncbi:alpha/beta hydrolase [Longitalea luteola]|uniref:alpha/beta hydrolase n=1 Tax=Longitalea luteola TaxID=2812563 RepID=UPI001A974C0E|nr:alpha/beta hydrolase [Longitalea luteola]